MSKIVWLASYPKSGNTWLCIFFANLQNDLETPADINQIKIHIASGRNLFEQAMGVETGDLTITEINNLRPKVFAHLADHSPSTLIFKIHDAFPYTPVGLPAITTEFTAGAIYIIRNPLDVALSFAAHCGISTDRSIRDMADEQMVLVDFGGQFSVQLNQPTRSWSSHVKSWFDQPFIPVHLVRYEDMLQNTVETFTLAARFAGLPDSPEQIQKAIQHSSFEALQQQEQRNGFREKSAAADSFFRKGRRGYWREELTLEQAARIIADHSEVMRRFGYLDEHNEPAY